jgi:hypothetical protein
VPDGFLFALGCAGGIVEGQLGGPQDLLCVIVAEVGHGLIIA